MPGHRVQTFYAFLALDDDDDESVPAFLDSQRNIWMPLVGSDLARVESLRVAAMTVAAASGHTLTLAKFTVREDMETITPPGADT